MILPRPLARRVPAWLVTLHLLGLAPFGVPIRDIAAQESDTPATGEVPARPECTARLEKIRGVYRGLPADMSSLTTAAADEAARLVDQTLLEGDRYFQDCKDAPEAPEVHFYQAKFLYLLSVRVERQVWSSLPKIQGRVPNDLFRKRMEPFYSRVAEHAGTAGTRLAKGSPFRPHALEIRGWALTKLEKHTTARDTYLEFLEAYRDHERAAAIAAALGRVYLDLEAYETGIRLIERSMKDEKMYESENFPHLGEVLWKLEEARGSVEGMLRAAETVLSLYPLRTASKSMPAKVREVYARFIDVSGFRKAYALLAQGRFADAQRAFQEHVQALNKKSDALRELGQELEPVASIYRGRSMNCLQFIEELAGRPAPHGLDLEGFWVTEKKTTLEKARGKVVGLVFRGVGDSRSATFVEAIDDFATGDDAVELVTVSYLRGEQNVDEQVTAMRQELLEIGYDSAAGLDPDVQEKGIFRAYNAYVGSATFIVINRRGEPVWFQQDPRTVDINLARRILTRVKDS